MKTQCKGCDYKPSEYDTLEGYCMLCAAKRVKMSEQQEQQEQQELSDHDRIIRIDVKTDNLETQFTNHLEHHFRYNILAWTVALGCIVTLAITLIKVL